MPRLRKLALAFYRQSAVPLARALIGKIIVHRVGGRVYRARIVETEAYLGPRDLASHASKGRTSRTEVMFGPPGRTYVYFIYGMYDMLNIVAGPPGAAQAVLIRAAEPLDGWSADLRGPGKLTRALRITTRRHNALPLNRPSLFLLDNPVDRPRLRAAKRIGVDYAKHWKHAMLRFVDAKSDAISKK